MANGQWNRPNLEHLVQEWRESREKKMASRLQLHSNKPRTISSSVLGYHSHRQVQLPPSHQYGPRFGQQWNSNPYYSSHGYPTSSSSSGGHSTYNGHYSSYNQSSSYRDSSVPRKSFHRPGNSQDSFRSLGGHEKNRVHFSSHKSLHKNKSTNVNNARKYSSCSNLHKRDEPKNHNKVPAVQQKSEAVPPNVEAPAGDIVQIPEITVSEYIEPVDSISTSPKLEISRGCTNTGVNSNTESTVEYSVENKTHVLEDILCALSTPTVLTEDIVQTENARQQIPNGKIQEGGDIIHSENVGLQVLPNEEIQEENGDIMYSEDGLQVLPNEEIQEQSGDIICSEDVGLQVLPNEEIQEQSGDIICSEDIGLQVLPNEEIQVQSGDIMYSENVGLRVLPNVEIQEQSGNIIHSENVGLQVLSDAGKHLEECTLVTETMNEVLESEGQINDNQATHLEIEIANDSSTLGVESGLITARESLESTKDVINQNISPAPPSRESEDGSSELGLIMRCESDNDTPCSDHEKKEAAVENKEENDDNCKELSINFSHLCMEEAHNTDDTKQAYVTPKKRILVDATNIIPSSTIQYSVKEVKVNNESCVHVTPVRRSLRTTSVTPSRRCIQNLKDLSPDRLHNVKIIPNPAIDLFKNE